jgi:Holliday junction resolvase
MQTIITVNPKELDVRLLNKIKLFARHEKGSEIQISIKKPTRLPRFLKTETKTQTRKRIDKAIEDLEKGRNIVKFSGAEFDTLTNLLSKKAS